MKIKIYWIYAMNVDEIRKGYQLETLMAAWWCKCMTIPKSCCKRLRWLKFCLVSSLDIWYFLSCWVSRNQMMWIPFHLQGLPVLFPFTKLKSSKPRPTGMIFFSPWRRTFRPRAFLKSLQVPINGTVALPEGSEKFTGEWYFMIFWGKWWSTFLFDGNLIVQHYLYPQILVWLALDSPTPDGLVMIGVTCSYKPRQEAVECIYTLLESPGCMAHVEACPIREVVQDGQHSNW